MIESSLQAKRDAGQKLLIPFLTGGCRSDWLDVVTAIAEAGADAIEIGIPFSDPMMDGPVIQEATRAALEAGTTPPGILHQIAELDLAIPIFVMTSYNICFRAGHERFAGMLQISGVDGAVLPDLPFDEARERCRVAKAAGVSSVLLAAPSTTELRLEAICSASTAWVYAMARLGVTGEQPELRESATRLARRLKACTELPVIIGMGISVPEQAALACLHADGVVVGSALVHRLLDGASSSSVAEFISELRTRMNNL